jgi:hypothetical protein
MRSPILAGQQGPINGEGGEVQVAPRLGAPPSLLPPVGMPSLLLPSTPQYNLISTLPD